MSLILSEDFDIEKISLKDLDGFKKVLEYINNEYYEIENKYRAQLKDREFIENKTIIKSRYSNILWFDTKPTNKVQEPVNASLAA